MRTRRRKKGGKVSSTRKPSGYNNPTISMARAERRAASARLKVKLLEEAKMRKEKILAEQAKRQAEQAKRRSRVRRDPAWQKLSEKYKKINNTSCSRCSVQG